MSAGTSSGRTQHAAGSRVDAPPACAAAVCRYPSSHARAQARIGTAGENGTARLRKASKTHRAVKATSVLFVTAAPDDRASTHKLERLVSELDRRRDARAALWYLRTSYERPPAPGTRVVDSLRTWPAAALAKAVGFTRLAAAMQGIRLRVWLRQLQPEVVVLDDGLGLRVVEHMRPRPPTVIRLNAHPPAHLLMEASPVSPETAELVIAPCGLEPPRELIARWRTEELLTPEAARRARRFADRSAVTQARRAMGLPEDELLIVGWGDDGWLDGPDLFVRTLWALERHHNLRVHGVWLGLVSDPDESARLRAEAEWCGVGQRFHHITHSDPAGRYCGDAVFLPYRCPTETIDLMVAACSGSSVVVFEAAASHDPLVKRVPALDVEAAAATLASELGGDRARRADAARLRFESLFEEILSLSRTRP